MTIGRYRPTVELPDGRRIRGHRQPAVRLPEHALRNELARQLGGIAEASLPYGRADVLTATAVYEVEPYRSWSKGVLQVLAYAAQTGLPPMLALFGPATREQVEALYLKLRGGRPPVGLWWHDGHCWWHVSGRAHCRAMGG